jgi:hypothetical protein
VQSNSQARQNKIIYLPKVDNRRADESRTTASAQRLSCYVVDDVTRPNMAYTEHSLILSRIVLAKFSITSREIFADGHHFGGDYFDMPLKFVKYGYTF